MIPEDLSYTDQHEWIRVEGTVGTQLAKGGEACAIESAKAAVSIYAPVGGKVVEANAELEDDPGLVNSSPYGQGWIYKIELADAAEVDSLMDAAKYAEFIAGEEAH